MVRGVLEHGLRLDPVVTAGAQRPPVAQSFEPHDIHEFLSSSMVRSQGPLQQWNKNQSHGRNLMGLLTECSCFGAPKVAK